METQPRIKICGITRESDAEDALELGADFLGINLYEQSPRGVSLARAAELLRLIPEGRRVCVDVNPGTDEMEARRELGFDFFQIHCPFNTGLGTLAGWTGSVGRERLWLAPKLPPEEGFPQTILEFADTVLFDTYARDPLVFGGTGRESDWGRFQEWRTLYAHKQWALAGGLGPDNLRRAMESTTADIYDVNSGVESAPGEKVRARLERLFAEWRKRA